MADIIIEPAGYNDDWDDTNYQTNQTDNPDDDNQINKDMQEIVISGILHNLIDLDPDLLRKIKTTLYISFRNYDVTKKCTEVAIVSYSWTKDLVRFLDRKRMAGKSERTIERYQYVLKRILLYCGKDIKEITEGDLNSYIENYKRISGVSNSTLDGVRLCMSSFFTWQHEHGFIPRNPSRGVDPIKVAKVIKKPYSDEELEKIKAACRSKRDKALIEFMYVTGVRVFELTTLNRDDVSFSDKTVIVYGKGDKEREVYLSDVSCMYLQSYLKDRKDTNEALFVTGRGKTARLKASGVRALLKRIASETGIDNVHPHRFRRPCATNLLRKGMPIEEVSMILGHEKLDTTRIYAISDKEKVKADHRRFMGS